MPLIKSSSKEAFSQNVSEMIKAGHPRDQALAAAYSVKRQNRAMGGPSANVGQAPWFVRQEARNITHTGPIMSAIPGRTDAHDMSVPSGSYIMPAHAVSHLGQNNTMAGMAVLNKMFPNSGPYNSSKMPIKHGAGAPKLGNAPMPHLKFANGRMSDSGGARGEGIGQPTEIRAAGGEYVVHPIDVMARGGGSLSHGHKVLDNWVMQLKKEHAETLKKLAGPAKN